MDQKLELFYRVRGTLITEFNMLAFAPDPSQTAVIAKEVIHLINQCMQKELVYLIRINGTVVAGSADHGSLDLKSATLFAQS